MSQRFQSNQKALQLRSRRMEMNDGLSLLLLLFLIPLNGCSDAAFQRDFKAMSHQFSQPSHSPVGLWEGTWESAAEPGKHAARALVSVNAQSGFHVQIELTAFATGHHISTFPSDNYVLDLRNVTFKTTSSGVDQFETKTRLEKAYRSSLVCEAMTLQGLLANDSLQIQFSTNDALNDLDHGFIDLRRPAAQ